MNTSNLAPIVLFVYNRPWHTRKTLEALAANELASESELYIYADGPRIDADTEDLHNINEVRKEIRENQWCGKVTIIESGINIGLANSILSGVTEVVNQHGRVIVLEDDIVIMSGFLQYMNEALELYKTEERVMNISSYWPKARIKGKKEQVFFLHFMSCWGWATWKDRWNKLNTDINYLYSEIVQYKDDFNLSDTCNFFQQIEQNISGKIKTWAIKWYASIYINKGLCLYPYKSLVQNIGIDGSGVHFTDKESLNPYKTVTVNHIIVKNISLNEDLNARKALELFYYRLNHKTFWYRIRRKILKIINNTFQK
jgi:GR25 family glycosyltransferase involved in LPS biosynthesis